MLNIKTKVQALGIQLCFVSSFHVDSTCIMYKTCGTDRQNDSYLPPFKFCLKWYKLFIKYKTKIIKG